MASRSDAVSAKGFSTITCLPARTAWMNWAAWSLGKLQMDTAWMSGSASIASKSLNTRMGEPYCALATAGSSSRLE